MRPQFRQADRGDDQLRLILEISDTGVGMDPESLESVFERFTLDPVLCRPSDRTCDRCCSRVVIRTRLALNLLPAASQ